MKWAMVIVLFGPVFGLGLWGSRMTSWFWRLKGKFFWSLFRSGLWGSFMTSCLWPGEGMEGGEEGRGERDWEEIWEVQIFLLLLISLSKDEKEEGKKEQFDKHFHCWRYLEICFSPTQLFLWCWEDYKVQVHPIPRITINNISKLWQYKLIQFLCISISIMPP